MLNSKEAVAIMLDLMGDTETYENPEYFLGLSQGLANACGLGSETGRELLNLAFISERDAQDAYRQMDRL